MSYSKKSITALLLFCSVLLGRGFAYETNITPSEANNPPKKSFLFKGEVKGDDINIRADATASAEVIAKIKQGEILEVTSESYDWYKVRLPSTTSVFIYKNLAMISADKSASVAKDNVNIRLRPDLSSPIVGKAAQDETLNILQEAGDWYKIEATPGCFGWIHKNYLAKIEEKASDAKKEEPATQPVKKVVTVEGLLKPKTMRHVATHKLIAEYNRLYLINGNIETLEALNNHRVKITGKLSEPTDDTLPIIEVEQIEAVE